MEGGEIPEKEQKMHWKWGKETDQTNFYLQIILAVIDQVTIHSDAVTTLRKLFKNDFEQNLYSFNPVNSEDYWLFFVEI